MNNVLSQPGRTAFDVAKLAVLARMLTSMEVHGHVVAALLKDARASAAARIARRNSGTHGVSGRAAWTPQCCGNNGQES